MKNNMIELIKKSSKENDFNDLNNIYTLYEQLQYATSIKEMAEDIFKWLQNVYTVDNLNFSLFDIEKNSKEVIFVKGEEFFLDDNLSFFFIINTHTSLNAVVSFNATSKTHFEIIQEKYTVIQSSFFQISPIIQSGILKKNFIESSSIDSVTNVYNRKYFIEHLNKQLLLSGQESSKITFLMIGIDHFKAVIDEFDYDVGDLVLVELAKVIHSNIKEYDLLARLAGDEFVVALTSNTDYDNTVNIAKSIIDNFRAIEVKVNDAGHSLKKTICVGIDTFDSQGSNSIDDVIKNADIALYEAKNKGRSEVIYFQKEQSSTIDLF